MSASPEDSKHEADARYKFPKVELHCHLDGCFRVPTIVDLAKKRGVRLPTYDQEEIKKYITLSSPCQNLREYLNTFSYFVPTFAGDLDAIARITREAVEDRAKDGVVYVELRYSPLLLANCDVTPLFHAKEPGRVRPKDVIEIVNKTVQEASEEFNINVGTILCNVVGFKDWGRQTAKLCHEYADQGVLGFDIAGPEGDGNYSSDCVQAFQYCKKNGIHRTAHAGEAGPASRVKMAIEQLDAERIGHGYHVVDSEDTYAMVKRLQTHIEVCPLSSHLTNSVPPDWSRHPVIRFHADKINYSLSTDDPGVQQSTLLDDYAIATREWNMTTQDLQNLNLNAARSCFLGCAGRQQLIADLEKAYWQHEEYDERTA